MSNAAGEQNEVQALINELKQMGLSTGYWQLDDQGNNICPNKVRIAEIGERLNEIGGFNAMQKAAGIIKDELGYSPYVIELSWAWNGIGAWQA
jgi:uncharacterized lipoprotein YddW (UPF0748 family)